MSRKLRNGSEATRSLRAAPCRPSEGPSCPSRRHVARVMREDSVEVLDGIGRPEPFVERTADAQAY